MSVSPAERRAVADRFGDLSIQIARLKPVVAEHKALREQIESWHSDLPPDQSYTVEGSRFDLQISPREYQRKIVDLAKLFLKLGKARFISLCTFPLKAIDACFTEAERAELVKRERTGCREVVAIPKAAAVETPATSKRLKRAA